MRNMMLVLAGSTLAVAAMLWMMSQGDRVNSPRSTGSLVVFCAASNRAVMEQVRQDYLEEYGVEVMPQYGPSQVLLSSIEVSGAGDLFLPADSSYLDLAFEKDLVEEILPIAKMIPVIAVKRGNPKQIQSLEDLVRDDVRFVQASPDAAAIGKVTKEVLSQSGKWQAIDTATKAYRGTVTDVANDIIIGAADAGFVYDAVLHSYPDLEFVEVGELVSEASLVQVGVLRASSQPQAALHFARYLSARDRGLARYAEQGFRTEGGDAWADVPELAIFAGSMLRPAIDETITEFEKREGVRVSRVYNGCGILVNQMQAGQRPDAYFACDSEFMTQVADLFPEPVTVSENELIILVQKGNPHKIASLRDLTTEGLRVGIGHEKKCAMGWLTQNTFRESGIQNELNANVAVQSPTGDMLVNQLRTGALDAAVVYLSNAAGMAEYLEPIRIEGLECSVATQPWAVAQESKYPSLASRLFRKICSAESREVFEAEGFRWQLPQQDD